MPALTATPAQRATLRAEAHALNPVVMIGADGLSAPVIAEIERNLDSHQLIKIRVFGDDRAARIDIYTTLCDQLNAAPVQHIGKLLVLWRPLAGADSAADRPGTPRKNAEARPPVRRGGVPAVKPRARSGAAGPGPRIVTVVKPTGNPTRRPKPKQVLVRGNERVTAGGNVKKAKSRQASVKRQRQSIK